jgi:hypothetical protein
MATALVSCSPVKLEYDANGAAIIVTLNNGKVKGITYKADDLFEDYLTTTKGLDAYKQAIYDVLVRDKYAGNITSDMESEIDSKIDSFIATAKKTASDNGTTYNTELSNALESAGVDDLGQLREVYTLDVEKSAYSDKYYEENMAATAATGNVKLDGDEVKVWSYTQDNMTWDYVKTQNPYHIRHILVKTDDIDGSSLYNKQISKAEAEKMYSVVSRLTSGESFGDIAYDASDDTSSTSYGSLGIVDTSVANSYVSEFRVAMYYYDAFLNSNPSPYTKEQKMAKLGISPTVKSGRVEIPTESTLNQHFTAIKYSDVSNLNKVADITSADRVNLSDKTFRDHNGYEHEIDDTTYPRDVLFNTVFNNRGLSFITSEGASEEELENNVWMEPSAEVKSLLGLADGVKILAVNQGTEENPYWAPILVAYNTTTGWHLILIEKSPLYQRFTSYVDWISKKTVSLGDDKTSETNLMKEMMHYYSQDVPSSSDDVTNANTYVTYLKTTNSTYSSRASDISTKIKEYDANVSDRLFESLIYKTENNNSSTILALDANGNKVLRDDIKIDEKMLNKITDYIEAKRTNTKYTAQATQLSAWSSYLNLLEFQDDVKDSRQYSLTDIKDLYNDDDVLYA